MKQDSLLLSNAFKKIWNYNQRNMKYLRIISLLLTCLALVTSCKKENMTRNQQPADRNPENNIPETKPPVQNPVYISVNGNIGGFYAALPARYDSTTKDYPLLIFCHGVGELGSGSASSLVTVLRNGPPRLINAGTFPPAFTVNGHSFSFIVLSPQFKNWPGADDINQLITYAIAHYRVDTTRVYLTGLSMGGGVTWDYAGSNKYDAKRVAAILPVCGAASPTRQKADTMAAVNLPVWALHNQNDPTVSSSNSVNFVSYINAATPVPDPAARLTIFPVSGHDAWSKAYDPAYTENGMNVYQWMLQYHR